MFPSVEECLVGVPSEGPAPECPDAPFEAPLPSVNVEMGGLPVYGSAPES